MAIEGRSDRKLLSRICLAASGRKGSSGVASAMLTMLPKLALVVMPMYFSVLAKVRRPSSHAAAQHLQVGAQQHHVGALAGHVHGLVDRNADIGRMQRRRVVDAVAQVADRVAGVLQRAHDALLLLRVDLDEQRGRAARGATAPRPHRVDLRRR